MHNNLAYSEHAPKINIALKWWRNRMFKIIFISFVILTIFAITLSLLLKFVILVLNKPETTTKVPLTVTTTVLTSLTATTSILITTTSVTTATELQSTTTSMTTLSTTATTAPRAGESSIVALHLVKGHMKRIGELDINNSVLITRKK
jgi:hypothetical protein